MVCRELLCWSYGEKGLGKGSEEWGMDLLEEPFNINDTLSVIPVGELSENVLGKIDIA
jgi:hypothetical protein